MAKRKMSKRKNHAPPATQYHQIATPEKPPPAKKFRTAGYGRVCRSDQEKYP